MIGNPDPPGRVLLLSTWTRREAAVMLQREIDPEMAADIEKFEVMLDRYLAGDLDDDVFRVFRLNNGVYGQRQGGHNQMIRCKVPYGSLKPEQLEMLAYVADEYS